MLHIQRVRRLVTFTVVMALCAILASGCSDVLSDPTFQTWCGDQLCAWKLESGQIRKASTWHPKDLGVELLDGPAPAYTTAISQKVTRTPKCLEFSVVADVQPQAQVSVQVDFDSDGIVEYEQPIAAVGFRTQKTQVTAPVFYTSITFTILKKGVGRSVLAMLDVRASGACTAPPEILEPQALGYPCNAQGNGDECRSGVCCQGLCSECCVPDDYVPAADGGADAGPTPEPPPGACSGNATCGTLPYPSSGRDDYGPLAGLAQNALPHQCDPGERQRPSGAECVIDHDCTSGTCEGAELTLKSASSATEPCASGSPTDTACRVGSAHGGRCR